MPPRQGLHIKLQRRNATRLRWRRSTAQGSRGYEFRRGQHVSGEVTDTFTRLAQENLNRLIRQSKDNFLKRTGLRLRHPRELWTLERRNEAEQSPEPKTEAQLWNDAHAQLGNQRRLLQIPGSDGPPITKFISNHEERPRTATQISKKNGEHMPGSIRRIRVPRKRAKESGLQPNHAEPTSGKRVIQQPSSPENLTPFEEDETIHKDLRSVLDTFRSHQAASSDVEPPMTDQTFYTEPAPGRRTSHLSRLASQYYSNELPFNGRNYSTHSRAPFPRRFASTSVSTKSSFPLCQLMVP